ncbi:MULTISPECIES: type I restriction endonuclease subunit R [Methanobacterium]|uniref:type I site-specific deoxyribonuclease n=1 Tax=Methanobacterium veterum TaxID=408577 RepID=A0A9E5A3A4_9EURY|nr:MULTISPECIES: type I restriction endonuclease subunit R [Methanobacterium]MCZ3367265.1 type I restriction endonuclease subunit R [Methanobacterium veterum]MCZ3373587.1 type I restriction endonuclease subunit R [Methanobacterium veterum]
MVIQSEAALEKCLIDKLTDSGYESIEITDYNDLKINFKTQLEKFNNVKLTDDEFERILIHLEGGTIFDKAKRLRDKYELRREDVTIYIDFFNKKDWCKNLFQVTNQVTMRKKYENRYDVTILINGLPLVQIELKRRGIELKKAFNQIKRYHLHSYKGLFQYIQIVVISNGVNTKYFANNSFRDLNYKLTFFWKDKNNKNISNLDDFVETFLERCHLSKMISKYMVLNETEKLLMILRAYQFYAVEAIVDQALNTNQNGYIWHTTGSGKTLTSFKVSQILSQEEKIDKVIFVVDRKDLDDQTTTEFNKFCNGAVDGTDNTYSLVQQLLGKVHPGEFENLIITTIQKLNRAVSRHEKVLSEIKDKKIILIFDECHRSQFGEMHKNITDYFTNLQYFGFTGTPIFAVNANNKRTTADIFGKLLHKYLIQNAINDNNVLGFSVEYFKLYKNKSERDLQVEGINTNELVESTDRLKTIAQYIVDNHNKKTYDREFNSIFAVSGIPILTKYYEIFKEIDHDLKIATIFSFGANEDLEEEDEHSRDKLERYISDYNGLFGTNFSTDTFGEYYKDVSRRSKDRKIDILLVVNMFLTGFDNKYLNTLYVDKNLRHHNLLQAYSRTNRILNEKKKHGNILCFRNLKDETDEAISLYSDENAPTNVLMKSYWEYVSDFKAVLPELFDITPDVNDVDDLSSEDKKKEFVQIFRELLRVLARLKTFTDFSFDNLGITQQKFEDYQSKYLDIYTDMRQVDGPEKISVLDDIDFEIELVRRDDINAAYILKLLKELDNTKPSFDKDKEFILNEMDKSYELKSKISLIEKFINENIPKIQDKDEFECHFEDYITKEKKNAVNSLIKEEKLNENVTKDIIAQYEFSEKIRNDLIKNSITERLGFIEKRSKVQAIKTKIVEIVDRFSW